MKTLCALGAVLILAMPSWADEPVETQKHSFVTAGVALHIPAKSSLANTLPEGELFEYWSADKTTGLSASVAPVGNPSADQFASQLALQLRGIKQEWDEKVDGEQTFRVNVPVQMGKVTSRTSLVTVSGGRALVITAFGTDPQKSEEAARQLARSASFHDPESPAENIDFSTKVGFAFGEPAARVVISAPEWLHAARSGGKQLLLSTYDFVSGKESLVVALTYTDVPPQMHVAEFAARMVPQMKARFGGKVSVMWASLPDNTKVYVSPVLKLAQPTAGTPSTYKMAMMEVAPGRILQVVFVINTDDTGEEKAYSELASAMIKGIKNASVPMARMPSAGPQEQATAAEEK